MHVVRLLCLVLALPLAGCLGMSEAETAAKKAELAAKDDEICRSYGAKPGSDVYVQCRVAQTQRRDAADNAAASAPVIVNNVNTTPQPPLYPTIQPMTMPGPRCTARGC
jgi:hypothetical protein